MRILQGKEHDDYDVDEGDVIENGRGSDDSWIRMGEPEARPFNPRIVTFESIHWLKRFSRSIVQTFFL
jgi:hypothetical protein